MVAAPHPCPSTSADSNKRKRTETGEEVQGSISEEEESKRMRDNTVVQQLPETGTLLQGKSATEAQGSLPSGSPDASNMDQDASRGATNGDVLQPTQAATDGWNFNGLQEFANVPYQEDSSDHDAGNDAMINIKMHLEGSPEIVIEFVPYSTTISSLIKLGALGHGIPAVDVDNYDLYDLLNPHVPLPLNRAHNPKSTLKEVQLLDGHAVKLRPSQPHLLFSNELQYQAVQGLLPAQEGAPSTPDSSTKHAEDGMHVRSNFSSPTKPRISMDITRGDGAKPFPLTMAASAKVLTVLQRACNNWGLDKRDWRLVYLVNHSKRNLDESKTLGEQVAEDRIELLLRPRQRPVVKSVNLKVMCDQSDEAKEISIPSTTTIGALKRAACKAWDITPKEYTMFDYFNQTIGDAYHSGQMQLTVADAKLNDGQHILLKPVEPGEAVDDDTALDGMDVQMGSLFEDVEDNGEGNSNGVVNTYRSPVNLMTRSGRQYGAKQGSGFGGSSFFRNNFHEDNAIQSNGRLPGLAGLSNLGNTCFMNSSLQCLAHAVPLLRAFLTGNYLTDLNRTNPLGMKGELAEGFGQLMHLLWQGSVSHVVPRKFKERIGRFAPQFSGYAQHDSQEFLAFLVDGLHEDLNRIKHKPYIEEKDSNGRPDAELAAEAWANYRARNDSTIVDHFQGLYKSRLDCPKCKYTSVKFDPFMYLSLPLPESRMRAVPVTTILLGSKQPPLKCVVEVANTGCVKDVHMAVWQLLGAQFTPAMQLDGVINDTSSQKPDMVDFTMADGTTNSAGEASMVEDQTTDAAAGPQPPMLTVKVMRHSWLSEEVVDIFPTNTRITDIVPSPRGSFNTEILVVYIYPYPRPEPPATPEQGTPVALPMGSAPESEAAAAAAGSADMDVTPAKDAADGQQQQQPAEPELLLSAADKGAGDTDLEPAGSTLPASASVGVLSAGTDLSELPPLLEEPAAGSNARVSEPPPPVPWLQAPFGVPFQPGAVPVVIHHRLPSKGYRANFFMVPLIMWLPAQLLSDTVQDLDLETPMYVYPKNTNELGVLGRGGQLATQAIHAALKAYRTAAGIAADSGLLQPVGTQQEDQAVGEDATAGEIAQSDASKHSSQPLRPESDGSWQHVVAPQAGSDTSSSGPPLYHAEDASPDGGQAAALSSKGTAVEVLHSAGQPSADAQPTDITAASPDNAGAMDGGGHMQHVRTPSALPMDESAAVPAGGSQSAMPTEDGGAAVADSQGGAPSSTPFAGHAVQPFNMWSAQLEQQQQHQQQAMQVIEPGEVTGPGFRLVLADDKASPYLYHSANPFNDTSAEKIWHVLAEWEGDGGGRWDMTLLDTEPQEHPSVAEHAAHHHAKPPVTLQACVDAFLQPEVLSEDDSWYCPRCKEHVQADKKLDLWALPEVLVVHLKRFSYTRYSRDKLDTPVEFPFVLDMDPYICGHDLYAPSSEPHANPAHPPHTAEPAAAANGYAVDAANGTASNGIVADVGLRPMDQSQPGAVQPNGNTHEAADMQAADMAQQAPTQQAADMQEADVTQQASTLQAADIQAADMQAGDTTQQGPVQEAATRPICSTPNGGNCGDPHDHKYELFGVVNHFGSLGGGHYTAHAKVPGINQWYNFDDSSVNQVNPAEVVSPAAYLLFWRRVSAVAADPPDLLPSLLAQHQARVAAQQQEAEQREREEQGAWGGEDDARPTHDQTSTFHGAAHSPQRTAYQGHENILDRGSMLPGFGAPRADAQAEQAFYIPASNSDVQLYDVQHQALSRGGSGGSGVHRGDPWRRSLSGDADYIVNGMQRRKPRVLSEDPTMLLSMAAEALQGQQAQHVQQEGDAGSRDHVQEIHLHRGPYAIRSHSGSHHDEDEDGFRATGIGYGLGTAQGSGGMDAWQDMNAFPVHRGMDRSRAGSSGAWSQENERGSMDGHASEVDLDEQLALHMSVGRVNEENMEACSDLHTHGDNDARPWMLPQPQATTVLYDEMFRSLAAQQQGAPDAASDSASGKLHGYGEGAGAGEGVGEGERVGSPHAVDVPSTALVEPGVNPLQPMAVSPVKCMPASIRAVGQYTLNTVNNGAPGYVVNNNPDEHVDAAGLLHERGLLAQKLSSTAPSTTWQSSSGVATDATGTLSSQAGGRDTSGGGSTGATTVMGKMAVESDVGVDTWAQDAPEEL